MVRWLALSFTCMSFSFANANFLTRPTFHSPSFTPTATRRPNTKKLVPAFAGVTRFSEASTKEAQSKILYRINETNMDIFNVHSFGRSLDWVRTRN